MRFSNCVRLSLGVVSILAVSLWSERVHGQGPEFKPYASTAGRFKAEFPGAVKTQTVPVKSDKVELNVTIDIVELRGGTSFLVTHVDAPDDVAEQPSATRLDKVRDGNKGPTGKLVSEKDLTLGTEKHPARDVLIQKGDTFVRNRIVIAGKRLYQVMVTGPQEVVTSPSADRFIESFQVTK